jgi:ABC-2 type transport system ATP-binding protein
MIEVDDLNVTYGDFAAVRGVSFQVRPGELYALLGTIVVRGRPRRWR